MDLFQEIFYILILDVEIGVESKGKSPVIFLRYAIWVILGIRLLAHEALGSVL